jgi:hypothetical protein
MLAASYQRYHVIYLRAILDGDVAPMAAEPLPL